MTYRQRISRIAARIVLASGLTFVLSPGAFAAEAALTQAGTSAACGEVTTVAAVTPDAALADCGCPPKGCVRTQGYWGNKPGVAWPAPYDRDAPFFNSSLSWQQVMDSPVRGDAYVMLAHQYIAAVLNGRAGASAPNSLRAILLAAGSWFKTATPGTCLRGACQLQRSWAGMLDEYNNGDYPGAPPHCAEDD
ncbi:hypothetical protein [Massilia sp. H6]|uniref:hypothetical protein n=1 Tax=Massilia sp. H6 TaxID=2970464 RepID=UPI0021696E59|nr:hypothetical protein [Massilia sp. H6]UVW27082.1 hypothetical protein NRS07_10925 [Massilia sp. H6]